MVENSAATKAERLVAQWAGPKVVWRVAYSAEHWVALWDLWKAERWAAPKVEQRADYLAATKAAPKAAQTALPKVEQKAARWGL